jgi:hypothetical protein
MDDNRLLTDDAPAAIAARFEELINLGISGHTDTWKRQKLLAMEISEKDIPALLGHIRAQDAANARLRGALAAVAALGELPYVPQDGCTADGRIEAANIAKRALDGEGGASPEG